MYMPFCILSHYPASVSQTPWKVQCPSILIFPELAFLLGGGGLQRGIQEEEKVKWVNVVPVLDQCLGHASWQVDKILLSLL